MAPNYFSHTSIKLPLAKSCSLLSNDLTEQLDPNLKLALLEPDNLQKSLPCKIILNGSMKIFLYNKNSDP